MPTDRVYALDVIGVRIYGMDAAFALSRRQRGSTAPCFWQSLVRCSVCSPWEYQTTDLPGCFRNCLRIQHSLVRQWIHVGVSFFGGRCPCLKVVQFLRGCLSEDSAALHPCRGADTEFCGIPFTTEILQLQYIDKVIDVCCRSCQSCAVVGDTRAPTVANPREPGPTKPCTHVGRTQPTTPACGQDAACCVTQRYVRLTRGPFSMVQPN